MRRLTRYQKEALRRSRVQHRLRPWPTETERCLRMARSRIRRALTVVRAVRDELTAGNEQGARLLMQGINEMFRQSQDLRCISPEERERAWYKVQDILHESPRSRDFWWR